MAMLEQATRRGLRLGLTGIGYDGEERDTVTLLPKPRIRVPAGALVTTSESCLQNSDARWTDLRRTGFRTALGEVVVVHVTAPGMLVVAGPNKTHELARVRQALEREGLELLMVDGSLNRIAPMAVVDRLVFSTGAARSTDLTAVAREMQAIESVLAIPEVDVTREGRIEPWPVVTVGMSVEEVVAHSASNAGRVRWKGLVGLDVLKAIAGAAKGGPGGGATVVLDDPLKLLLAGEVRRVREVLTAVREAGTALLCERKPHLAAVTSNPFFPAYDGSVYSGGMVEGERLLQVLRDSLHVPVVDVVREGGDALFAAACGL